MLASCSIPWVFAPVTIDGREYVDGGVWSPTNLDATPARRGTEVLCLNPTAARAAAQLASPTPPRWRSRSRCGRAARACAPSAPTTAPPRRWASNLMDRSRVPEALAAGYAQGLALAA